MRVVLWGPGEVTAEFELTDASEVLPALARWAEEVGVRAADIDYQIDGGLKVLGESSAQAALIDVCGLPRPSGRD